MGVTSEQNESQNKSTLQVKMGREDPPNLRRQLGLISSISYITGTIIGVGIFISPSSILEGAGSSVGLSLIIWFFCGMISYCGALCYAELGTRVNKSGGSYTYIKDAFGDCAGFVFLWTQLVLVRPLATSLGCLAAAEYIVRPVFLDCPDMAPRIAKILLSLVVMGTVMMSNCHSVRLGAFLQTSATACELFALVTIIVGGVLHMVQGHVENFEKSFETKDLTPGGLVLAIYAGIYAFMGWDQINNAVEEITNPQRTIPVAILFGLAIPTVTYILANVAYHAVLTNEEILSGVAVAVVCQQLQLCWFCDTFPQWSAQIFGERKLGWFTWAIIPCIGISAAATANAMIFSSSRLNFVGGRDGLFPRFLGMVNVEKRTPQPSIIALAFVSLIFLCLGNVKSVLGTYSFFRALGEVIGIACIFRLRRMHKAKPSTYEVHWMFPIIYLTFFAILSLTAIISKPREYLVPLAVALAGIPVYYLSQTNMWKTGSIMSINRCITKICFRLLLCDYASKTE